MEYLVYFYNLPVSLLFILVAIWKRSQKNFFIISLGCFALLISVSVFFPAKYSIQAWLSPAGNIAYLCLITWLFFSQKTDIYLETGQLELPNRQEIKEQIEGASGQMERQRIYLGLIKKTSLLWQQREEKVTKINSKLILTGSFAIFLIAISVLTSIHFFGYRLDVFFLDLFSEYTAMLKQVNASSEQSKPILTEQEIKEVIQNVLALGPGLLFIAVSLVFIFVGNLFKIIEQLAYKKYLPVASLSNFIISDKSIWLFIVLLGLQLLNFNAKMDETIMTIVHNLSLIILFLYVLHGYSIIRVYINVRLLMFKRITTIVFLISVLFMNFDIFMGLLGLYVLVGLFDFWFYFRKKALQPKFNLD